MHTLSLEWAAAAAALIGLLVGIVATLLMAGGRNRAVVQDMQSALDTARQEANDRGTALRVAERERDLARESAHAGEAEAGRLRSALSDAERRVTQAETGLQKERQAFAEKEQALVAVRDGIEKDLKVLAGDLLQKNTDGFIKRATEFFETHQKQNKEGVETLVKPIGEALKTYQDKLAEMEQARKKDEGALKQELKQLDENHRRLHDSTTNLVHALRSAPKTRGRWGEQQLKTVLEMAGMMEHVDFLTEHSVKDEQGKVFRPDVVVRLPGDRFLVVDAKTNLDPYMDAFNEENDTLRQEHLKRFVQGMRTHVNDLGSKQYWDCFENAPDFVIMFVPGDNFYSAAIQYDPDLIEFAYGKKVIIATPTTFLGLARTVAFTWRQQHATRNAQEVLSEASLLYKRLQTFGGKVSALTKAITGTVTKHDELVGSLEKSVMPKARKLQEMGIASDKQDIDYLEPINQSPRLLAGNDFDLNTDDEDAPSDVPQLTGMGNVS